MKVKSKQLLDVPGRTPRQFYPSPWMYKELCRGNYSQAFWNKRSPTYMKWSVPSRIPVGSYIPTPATFMATPPLMDNHKKAASLPATPTEEAPRVSARERWASMARGRATLRAEKESVKSVASGHSGGG